jgi:hypothetical protein
MWELTVFGTKEESRGLGNIGQLGDVRQLGIMSNSIIYLVVLAPNEADVADKADSPFMECWIPAA